MAAWFNYLERARVSYKEVQLKTFYLSVKTICLPAENVIKQTLADQFCSLYMYPRDSSINFIIWLLRNDKTHILTKKP